MCSTVYLAPPHFTSTTACCPALPLRCAVQELLWPAGRLLLCRSLFQPLPTPPRVPAVPAALRLPGQRHIRQPADRGSEWAAALGMQCGMRACMRPASSVGHCLLCLAAGNLVCVLARRPLQVAQSHAPLPQVQAKGSASEFVCGAPLSFWSPELPGFSKLPGKGLFISGPPGLPSLWHSMLQPPARLRLCTAPPTRLWVVRVLAHSWPMSSSSSAPLPSASQVSTTAAPPHVRNGTVARRRPT